MTRGRGVKDALTHGHRQVSLDEMTAVPPIDQLKDEIAPGTPIEQLTAASDLSEQLRARADELLDQFVDAARASGSSWSEIGCSLGTSKQAAQQRFAALAEPPPGQAPFGLTGTAADVLTDAATQARELGHHYIRPEHLILGLLRNKDADGVLKPFANRSITLHGVPVPGHAHHSPEELAPARHGG